MWVCLCGALPGGIPSDGSQGLKIGGAGGAGGMGEDQDVCGAVDVDDE